MGEIDQKIRAPKTFVGDAGAFMSKFRDATFKRNTRPLIVHKVGLIMISFILLMKLMVS